MFGFSIVNTIAAIAGAAVGAAVCFGVLSLYDSWYAYPQIRKETTAIVEAQSRLQTEAAINEVNDTAERARAMRRHCSDIGLQYNSGAVTCRQ